MYTSMYTRLASSVRDVQKAQQLRHTIFIENLDTRVVEWTTSTSREEDRFDAFAKHLITVERSSQSGCERVVGTCRILDRNGARQAGGFYSEEEFDIAPILGQESRVLEVGRWCIHPHYQGGNVALRLWKALTNLVRTSGVQMLFGCASFPGLDPNAWSTELRFVPEHISCARESEGTSHQESMDKLSRRKAWRPAFNAVETVTTTVAHLSATGRLCR